MSGPIAERNIHLDLQNNQLNARGYSGRIEFYGDPGSYPGYEGLSWRTLKYEDLDASVRDGALADLQPGRRIPAEMVVADKIFSEVPLSGNLVFLHVDKQKNVSAFHFDSERERDSSFLFDVAQGEVFCWFALGNKAAQILEYEEPGFTDDDLKLIDPTEKDAYKEQIPETFWTMVKQLERGQTKDTVIPITEVDEIYG